MAKTSARVVKGAKNRTGERRVAAIRAYAGRVTVAPAARPVLRGELAEIGLSTVLTLMEMERRTGLLVAKRGRVAVRLEIREGQVIRARAEGPRADANGVDAVFEALGWEDGQFQLFGVKVVGRDEIGLRTAFLLMEGMRRLDEARGVVLRAPQVAGALELAAGPVLDDDDLMAAV